MKGAVVSPSDSVRQHSQEVYVRQARHRGATTFTINVGEVHKALALKNRVPLVCMALKSKKFLDGNGLRLVSETGPPSGQSTTVTYTYEFMDKTSCSEPSRDPWTELRGIAKDIFAALGGGEAFIRSERAQFSASAAERESGGKA